MNSDCSPKFGLNVDKFKVLMLNVVQRRRSIDQEWRMKWARASQHVLRGETRSWKAASEDSGTGHRGHALDAHDECVLFDQRDLIAMRALIICSW